METPVIERILCGDQIQQCEMRDLRKGDWFRTQDGSGAGPWLEAEEDASLRPHPNKPEIQIWGVKTLPYAVVPL